MLKLFFGKFMPSFERWRPGTHFGILVSRSDDLIGSLEFWTVGETSR